MLKTAIHCNVHTKKNMHFLKLDFIQSKNRNFYILPTLTEA